MVDTAVHLDLNALDELKEVMGDEFPVLVETFEADSVIRISAIKDALAASDSDALRRAAHSFKGSASNMGAVYLTELCRRLEEMGRSGSISEAEVVTEEIINAYSQVESAMAQVCAI